MALAIFDLDETLIDGDCASLWAQHMVDLQWVDGDSFLAREQELMRLLSVLKMLRILRLMLRSLKRQLLQ